MLFQTDHSQAGNFEPIPNGEYEAIISEVELKTGENSFNSGNEGVKLTLTIRADVDQPAQKRKVWDNLVYTQGAIFKFQQVAKAVGIPNGEPIHTLEDFREKILYKPVRIKIQQKQEVYQGETKIRENVMAYKEATVEYDHTPNEGAFNVPDDALDISDDDLPF